MQAPAESAGKRKIILFMENLSLEKLSSLIALTCKLIDLGYQTIFIVMNDNTELEGQNFDRFHSAPELNPTPLKDTQLRPDWSRIAIDKQQSYFVEKL